MSADTTIRDILAKYGEKHDKGTVWAVQGTPVILHKALERIAAKAGITFDVPQILRAERDEAVMLVVGHLPAPEGARTEWSVGEALVGANYRVSGKQAAYVWAMAEKRAKDRVILKLIGLHGLAYSEEEADQFKDERPRSPASGSSAAPIEPANEDGDIRSASERMADNMIEQLRERTGARVDRLLNHAEFQRDLALLDRPDYERVAAVAEEQRRDAA